MVGGLDVDFLVFSFFGIRVQSIADLFQRSAAMMEVRNLDRPSAAAAISGHGVAVPHGAAFGTPVFGAPGFGVPQPANDDYDDVVYSDED
jgi:hypothetical protein